MLKPLYNYVLLEHMEEDNKTASGIISQIVQKKTIAM